MTEHKHPHHHRPSFWSSFSKSQLSSATATVIEYSLLFSMTELFHIWYVPSVAAGAITGAIANFLINRHWSFRATHRRPGPQLLKYTIVSAGSVLLNTGGVYAMTEYLKIHYAISVVIVGLIVGFFYNFPLHRAFVFR
jgi:putative flippase GtrA